jgi:hypothetical protein
MAQPPKLKRFAADAFEGAEDWFLDGFLPAFNDFATTVTNALSGALSAPENINAYVEKGVRVLLGATPAEAFPIIIANRLGRIPESVSVASYSTTEGATPTVAVGIRWDVTGDGRVRILDFPGLQASSEYRVNLKVE